MADLADEIAAWVAEIGVDHERTGPRELLIRVPTRMRGPFAVVATCAERTVTMSAFLLRAPDRDAAGFYRRALRRNLQTGAWRFAADDDGDLYLAARLWLPALSREGIDEALGELSMLVDDTYEGLMRTGFDVPEDVPVGPPPEQAG